MLTLYRILIWLASPLLIRRLHKPAAGKSALESKRRERRGHFEPGKQTSVWIHAASVGEVNAAQGLIEALLERYPDEVLVSTFTVTGAERVEALFSTRVRHRFAPVDTRASVQRWFDAVQPRLGIVLETEIWPELFEQASVRALPLILVNARLTARNQPRALQFRSLFARALKAISLAICQSDEDATRLIELGLPEDRIRISGNLKFDSPMPTDLGSRVVALRKQWGERPAWVAGSTRSGEESIVLEAHRQLLQQSPDALLVLAPRHPERAAEIGRLIEQNKLGFQVLGEPVTVSTSVVLVDRIGQLLPCYAAASAVFVGGSLVNIGGHNLLEPAGLGKAVLCGPHLHQQAEASTALQQAGALLTVTSATELADQVARLWGDPEFALTTGRAALGVVESGRGSLRRTLRWLTPWLP